MNNTINIRLMLAIGGLRFLRTREKLLLAEIIYDVQQFLSLTRDRISRIVGRKVRIRNWNGSEVLQQCDGIIRYIESGNIEVVTYWDSDYPPQLREIYDPPFLLYYKGHMPVWNSPAVAAVGTRRPTGKALKAAYRLGLEFAVNGVPVVSGLARGIDQSVHRGVLDGGGTTVAVLGCGIDRIYPWEHKTLAEDIIKNKGTIVSEYAPGIPPLPYNFPERNRIISGLCRTVVVVQSPEKSGALITADYALEQGRDLSVHADGLDGPAGKGCRQLAEDGAPIITGAVDVLSDWGESAAARIVQAPKVDHDPAGVMMANILEKELSRELFAGSGEYLGLITG